MIKFVVGVTRHYEANMLLTMSLHMQELRRLEVSYPQL
jgi:hypothetical protein